MIHGCPRFVSSVPAFAHPAASIWVLRQCSPAYQFKSVLAIQPPELARYERKNVWPTKREAVLISGRKVGGAASGAWVSRSHVKATS